MHFKSGDRSPKAVLEIGDKTYKIFSPTVGQADRFTKAYSESKENPEKLGGLMKSYICELGSIPPGEIEKIENDLFYDVFSHVINSVKKN